jgi:hypothetical protein
MAAFHLIHCTASSFNGSHFCFLLSPSLYVRYAHISLGDTDCGADFDNISQGKVVRAVPVLS